MNVMICPICSNGANLRLTKKTTDYYQCFSCKTLFSGPLENSDMVGGGNEIQRNKEQNQGRIERFTKLFGGANVPGIKVLDFGCGTGYLYSDLNESGFNCDGYDAYNPNFSKLPETHKYHLCSMVEVIEHLSSPFLELDCIHRSLLKGGVIYIETSFVDIAEEENIPLDTFFYVEPSVGHSTIFSHHGLDVLMVKKGFWPMQHYNRNVRLYVKQ